MSPEFPVLILTSVIPVTLILPSGEFAIFTLIGVAGGLYLFVRGFRLLARKRLLLNTPTSKVRSASLGLVEVCGLATGPYTVNSPITGTPCFLYRTTVWQKNDESRSGEWKKVAEETLHVPFYLDDGTGRLLIQPQGAELELHRDFRQDYSDTIFSPHAPQETLNFLTRHGVAPDNKIRVEECAIRPQSQLFVVGTLAENPGIEVQPFAMTTAGKNRVLSITVGCDATPPPPREVIRLSTMANLPASANATQQSKIAAALTKAGITRPDAWAAAGVPYGNIIAQEPAHISRTSVKGKDRPDKPGEQSAFDLTPPVVLMKGENNPAFLISWQSQHDLVRSLAWKSAAMIWGGGALALLGIYVLLQQL